MFPPYTLVVEGSYDQSEFCFKDRDRSFIINMAQNGLNKSSNVLLFLQNPLLKAEKPFLKVGNLFKSVTSTCGIKYLYRLLEFQ